MFWLVILLGPIVPLLAFGVVYYFNQKVKSRLLKPVLKSLTWGLGLAVCLNLIIWFVELVLPVFINNHCSGDGCAYFFLGLILGAHIISLIVSLMVYIYLMLTKN